MILFIADEQEETNASEDKANSGFISYIVKSLASYEAKIVDAKTMVSNLSAAIVLQYLLMELSGVKFREESAASLNDSESYTAIQQLTFNLCDYYFTGKKCMQSLRGRSLIIWYCNIFSLQSLLKGLVSTFSWWCLNVWFGGPVSVKKRVLDSLDVALSLISATCCLLTFS